MCCRSTPSCTSSRLLKANAQRMRGADQKRLPPNSLLGGHSELDPRLPIPNRTVKRLCADDSADCPRESRSPPGASKMKKPTPKRVGFFICALQRAPTFGTKTRLHPSPGSGAALPERTYPPPPAHGVFQRRLTCAPLQVKQSAPQLK